MLRDFHRTTISVSRRWKSILAGILAILCIYFNRSSQYFKPSKLTESIINEGRDTSSEQDLGIVHNAGPNNGEFYRFFPVSDSQGFEDSPSLARHGLHTVWHSSANLNPSDSIEALSASSDTTADVERPSLAGEYHFFQVDQHAAPTLSATSDFLDSSYKDKDSDNKEEDAAPTADDDDEKNPAVVALLRDSNIASRPHILSIPSGRGRWLPGADTKHSLLHRS